MSKSFLVTGAAGFIGSHVCQAMLERGDTVLGLDNLNDYYDPKRKESNIEEVRRATGGARGFELIVGDLRECTLLARLFAALRFSAIVHLGGMGGVRASMADPQLYLDVNLGGTLNLLNEARIHKIDNFVLASTSSVYGRTTTIPFIETDLCDRPQAPYAASKRAAEMLGFTYHHLYGQNFTALRFFTVYGPRGRPDMMPYKLLDNMYFNREVPLYNNGQMHRDWTYVGDIVNGVLAAADRPLGYEIINLGRGEPVLLSDFIRSMESAAGRKAHLIPAPMMDADVAFTFADITKARRLLGYEPRVSVDEGTRRFFDWYRTKVIEKP